MRKKTFKTMFGGRELVAEFSDLAENAQGSVILRYGDAVLLATVCMSKRAKEGGDFFPLTVDYEERFYAVGKILGSEYRRRESNNDQAILNARVVDRTIRPLFDIRMRHEVQVVITTLALGMEPVDVLAIIASSLALGTSPIPWNGSVGAISVSHKDGMWDIMQMRDVRGNSVLTVCGKNGDVNMIEMEGSELSEDVVMEGLEIAAAECSKLVQWQNEIIDQLSVVKKDIDLPEVSGEIKELFEEFIRPRFEMTIFAGAAGRRDEYDLLEEWMAIISSRAGLSKTLSFAHFDNEVNELLHKKAINEGKRPDGRAMDEIRELFAEAGGFANTHHGTGIFYRGGTHVLSVATLGAPEKTLEIENIEEEGKRRYWHHYNFPPFSSGETGRAGVVNRRAVGHGVLAEKALLPVLPDAQEFPYTIRVVSEALASNGSTSMASVCGSTLALMDAGVPIKKPVAGIASGLMMRSPDEYKVLTDIQGPEDHHGDMDFKVAGTSDGITAIQMDVKVEGIPLNILREAFVKAKNARENILIVLKGTIREPRSEVKPHVPKILTLKVRPDQIRTIIGSGGKVVQEIRTKTGAEVEVEDDGSVYVMGKNGASETARDWIEKLVYEFHVGETYEGEVIRMADFGAWVNIGHDKQGMVHVSELAPWHVEKPSDVLAIGEVVPVVVTKIDERGLVGLSIKKRDEHFFDHKNKQ